MQQNRQNLSVKARKMLFRTRKTAPQDSRQRIPMIVKTAPSRLKNCGPSYYRARYYDPMAGRFISEDPINFDGGVNFYSYVLNDPVLFNDPMGFSATGKCLKACLKIYYGLTRDAGVVLAISAPIIPKAFSLGGAGATSIASPILRRLWPKFVPGGIWAPTIGNLASRTPIAGAALARWLPVAGLALTAIDVYGIQDCTRQCVRDNWFPCSDN